MSFFRGGVTSFLQTFLTRPSDCEETSEELSKLEKNQDISSLHFFRGGAWHEMLRSEGIEPYGEARMTHSVRSLWDLALRSTGANVERIALIIMNLELVGRDFRAELGDITGVVIATVNKAVFRAQKGRGEIRVGTVLVLQDMSGLLCFENKVRQPSASVHLSIQISNIVKVYQPSAPLSESSYICTTDLRQSYVKHALSAFSAADNALLRRLSIDFLVRGSVPKRKFGKSRRNRAVREAPQSSCRMNISKVGTLPSDLLLNPVGPLPRFIPLSDNLSSGCSLSSLPCSLK